MTISFRGATGLTANTVTAVTWTLPAGVATDDLLIAAYSGKPFNATFGATSPPQGYTAAGSAVNGAVANGNGTGSNHTIAYYKVHSGSEGATMAGTVGVTPSPSMAGVIAFDSSRSGSTWAVTSTVGQDTTTTGTTFSATGSATLDFKVGDVLLVIVGTPDNVGPNSSFAVSASGVTFGTASQTLGTTETATGNDGSLNAVWFPVTATGGAATPTFTMTTGSGDSNGAASFLLIREPQTATGTVAGSFTLSGTITSPDKGGKGTVAGSFTLSATASGTKKATGTVIGVIPALTGTITGTKQEANNYKTGSVTGSFALSGTVAGTKKTTGTVAGAFTLSATIEGTEGRRAAVAGTFTLSGTVAGTKKTTGTVTGSLSLTGTVAGTAARHGTVAGSMTLTGVVVGTADQPAKSGTVTGSFALTGTVTGSKYDPDAPTAPEETGGGASGYPATRSQRPRPKPAPVRKSGTVSGRIEITAKATGTKAISASLRATIDAHAEARGMKSTWAAVHARVEFRHRIDGDAVYPMSSRQVRQRRDDAELLLLI